LVESNDLLQELQSFSKVVDSPWAQEWWGAMCDEHQFLIKNNTWVLTDLPTQPKLVSCKWVYKIKTTCVGEKTKYKA
jgi:hypothetical protein